MVVVDIVEVTVEDEILVVAVDAVVDDEVLLLCIAVRCCA